MQNIFYYVMTVLIWGTTWLGIKFQLGSVDPMVSVAYRFSLAAALLMIFCRVTGRKMRFEPVDHIFMAMQGFFLFSVNYWLFYLCEKYIASGLAAVAFSTIVFMNVINGAVFLKSPIKPRVVAGSIVGLAGILLVFRPELSSFQLSDEGLFGLGLGLAATFMASVGNIISARNQKKQIPVIQANAYGMTYGALMMVFLSLVTGKPIGFEPSLLYVGSLIYLALFGSIIAFGCYLTLIGRIGADRAAYATLLFPLVALELSAVFEGYRWTPLAFAGIVLIMTGNLMIIKRRNLVTAHHRVRRDHKDLK